VAQESSFSPIELVKLVVETRDMAPDEPPEELEEET